MAQDRKQAEGLKDQGNAQLQKGDLAAAEKLFRAAIAADPRYPNAWCNLGVALRAGERNEEALEVWQQGIATAEPFPGTHFNLGLLLLDRGEVAKAADQLQRAVELAPGDPKRAAVLATVLATAGEGRAAASVACGCVFAAEGIVSGEIFKGEGFQKKAVDDALKPDAAASEMLKGLRLIAGGTDEGTTKRAVAAFQNAVNAAPEWPDAHFAHGRALMRAYKLKEGMKEFARSLELAKKEGREGEPLYQRVAAGRY